MSNAKKGNMTQAKSNALFGPVYEKLALEIVGKYGWNEVVPAEEIPFLAWGYAVKFAILHNIPLGTDLLMLAGYLNGIFVERNGCTPERIETYIMKSLKVGRGGAPSNACKLCNSCFVWADWSLLRDYNVASDAEREQMAWATQYLSAIDRDTMIVDPGEMAVYCRAMAIMFFEEKPWYSSYRHFSHDVSVLSGYFLGKFLTIESRLVSEFEERVYDELYLEEDIPVETKEGNVEMENYIKLGNGSFLVNSEANV